VRRAAAGLLTFGVGVVLWRRLRDRTRAPDPPPDPSPAPPSGGCGPVASNAVAGGVSAPVRVDAPAPAAAPSRKELYARAQERGIQGRSKMSKEELRRAVDAAST